jgi:hypothetical protein
LVSKKIKFIKKIQNSKNKDICVVLVAEDLKVWVKSREDLKKNYLIKFKLL